ncbi:cell growth-regulating nucleolar protein isoform X1 [Lissotriton helveticus]
MVFFTCNACGESLKKVQVEKHLHVCRSSSCLSCIDCGKDFWGDDYKHHLKCISEDQKYGGKGFEAKANKGEVKQLQWIQKVHEVMKNPNISPKLRDILKQMSTYDNIPRKRAKFQNWMKNSLKIHDQATQEKVWQIFSEANDSSNVNSQEQQPSKMEPSPVEQNEETPEGTEKKCKRERKEERQKNKKKEKKELKGGILQDNFQMKKTKKRRHESEGTVEEVEPQEAAESIGKERKKKKHRESNGNVEGTENGHDIETTEYTETKDNLKKTKYCTSEENGLSAEVEENEDADESTVKVKFNWKGTIKAVLKEAPDNEMSIKKLRKKVLAQYYSVVTEHYKSRDDVLVTFKKKINCNPKFRILKEKVKLVR